MARAIFISYDGLLDQLGGSQILPYVQGLTRAGWKMHVLSFEKRDRFVELGEDLARDLNEAGISWTPLSFTSSFGKLGKLWDLLKMHLAAVWICHKHQIRIIHCRSYLSMQVGVFAQALLGGRTIFDMRSLWVDERVEGGLWPQDNRLYQFAFRTYKRIEKFLLRRADHVVVLTQAVVPELKRISPAMKAPVTVIPCCADFEHFEPSSEELRADVRRELGIPENAFVLSYLGSIGSWYMFEEMLLFFKEAAVRRDDVHFLFVTRNWSPSCEATIAAAEMNSLRARIHVRSAERAGVPRLLGASDVMLSFIKPCYSKMGSCPTKLAEAFALGVPVISNCGVGDVEEITRELDAGAIVDLTNPQTFSVTAVALDQIRDKGGLRLRQAARTRFGLERAEDLYRSVYDRVSGEPPERIAAAGHAAQDAKMPD